MGIQTVHSWPLQALVKALLVDSVDVVFTQLLTGG